MATSTPNIGLQIPAYDQGNWQVQLNYDLGLLDLIFGGQKVVPALSVTNLTATNLAASLLPLFVAEAPSGAIPGSTFTLSATPSFIIGIFYNGAFQRPGIDYTVSGSVVTLSFSTVAGDNVWAVYFKVV